MGIYDVYVIGGWYVDLGKFNFYLSRENVENKKIRPKEVILKYQSYYRKKRTKKIFSFTINKGGKYKIEFEKQNTLVIKKRSLFAGYFFGKKIDFKEIEIIIERK